MPDLKEIPVKFKYVGPHDAVDLPGVGTVRNGDPFETDLDLSGRDDFVTVKVAAKKEG